MNVSTPKVYRNSYLSAQREISTQVLAALKLVECIQYSGSTSTLSVGVILLGRKRSKVLLCRSLHQHLPIKPAYSLHPSLHLSIFPSPPSLPPSVFPLHFPFINTSHSNLPILSIPHSTSPSSLPQPPQAFPPRSLRLLLLLSHHTFLPTPLIQSSFFFIIITTKPHLPYTILSLPGSIIILAFHFLL